MASEAIFSSLRRRRSPSLEAFLALVYLSDVALVQTLVSVTAEIISSFSDKKKYFQKINSGVAGRGGEPINRRGRGGASPIYANPRGVAESRGHGVAGAGKSSVWPFLLPPL